MSCKTLFLTVLSCAFVLLSSAQIADQPNIDFELGNTSVWNYYEGVCCPLLVANPTAPLPNRHVLTTGNTLDFYGQFPVVSPDGGHYSLKLGNSNVGAEAERAEYFVHVPAGISNYSLIFRYAVVFEDPSHDENDQPRFAVNAYDSANDAQIPCAQYLYIASSSIPGFKSAAVPNEYVKYKEWTTASINLTGYAGRTVKVHFTSGDCSLGGHFGYGYIDVSGGLFAISTKVCGGNATLTGPAGFERYLWYDGLFTGLIDSSLTTNVSSVPGIKSYALVLEPYPGYGCPDTLYTTVTFSHTQINSVTQETCNQDVSITGPDSFMSYHWYDGAFTTLIDTGRTTSFHKPVSGSIYALVVYPTDSSGCIDTIYTTVNPPVATPEYSISTIACNKRMSVLAAPAGFYSYMWVDPVTMNTIGNGRTLPISNPDGTKTYAVVVVPYAGANCPDSLLGKVRVSELISIPMADVITCKGTNVILQAGASGGLGSLSYSWSPANMVSCTSCPTATAIVEMASRYVVTITDDVGCSIDDTMLVFMDNCLITVPNAFTPNGDGKNDLFRVLGVGYEYFDEFAFAVYNRFGERVFYTENLLGGWDGVFKGVPQEVGTYFFMVLYRLGNEQQMLKGDVTLVR